MEYSQVSPLEAKTTLQTVADSRDIDVSALTPRVRVVAAEWPSGEYPPTYVPFALWGDTLTLDVAGAPAAAEDVNVYWHKTHAINGRWISQGDGPVVKRSAINERNGRKG